MVKIFLSLILVFSFSYADWQSQIGGFFQQSAKKQTAEKTSTTSLTNYDMSKALKEALAQGVKFATSSLGKEGGYLNNPLVKIPLPENLQKSAGIVRKLGGEKYIKELEISMNKAAQKAAPKTAEIFIESIKNMSIEDAKKILSGDKHSATEYFKEKTDKKLTALIKPIIKESMKESSVYTYYKTFNSYYKKHAKSLNSSTVSSFASQFGLDSYIPKNSDVDLDDYVTTRAIDGLMKMIAKKEEEIRANPLMGNTKLIKKVFSYFDY